MKTATVNGELWGARAEAWSRRQEIHSTPLYEAVFDATGVAAGTHLLDAGCGSGLALQLATGRGATVTGLDASFGLLAVARDRMPDADLREGELEELPYPDKVFDVATGFNSIQFAGDPARALAELARVVRPGGLVAVATWGQPEASDVSNVMAAIGPLMPPPPPGAAAEGPFALSAPGRLEAFIEAAGLVPVQTAEVGCPMKYPNLDTAMEGLGSTGVMVVVARHAGEDALRERLGRGLAPFLGTDGSVHMNNTFRFVVARVPTAP